MDDVQLEGVKERKDKFQSNLFKARIEQKLMVSGIITGLASKSLKDSKEMSKYQSNEQSLYFCAQCEKLMTLSQSEFISCLETPGNPE